LINASLKALLDAIGSREAPRGYGQIYGGAKGVPPGTDVSRMSLNDVQALQRRLILNGSVSAACGRYQFIHSTLDATIHEMGLSGEEIWDPDLQDAMAVHLIEKRGFARFLAGDMSDTEFADALAAEWASLPMTTGPLKGHSKYTGDGLNKSFHTVDEMLALVDALRIPGAVPDAPMPQPRVKPRGLLSALIDFIRAIFKRRT
jgi:muramidase (phage lysozyme)